MQRRHKKLFLGSLQASRAIKNLNYGGIYFLKKLSEHEFREYKIISKYVRMSIVSIGAN